MGPPLVTRTPIELLPDPSRVIASLFVAGLENVGGSESRASGVVERILALDESVVVRRIADLQRRFAGRHRDLLATYGDNADRLGNRLDPEADLSEERWLLLGAAFTHEFAVEAISLCNPSIVAHPDQSDAGPDDLRFVLSLRGIGEGHRSSIAFRTGTVRASTVTVDEPGPFTTTASVHSGIFTKDVFHGRLRALGGDGETAASVLDQLPATFTQADLEARLSVLTSESETRRGAQATATRLRAIAACSYVAAFPDDSELSERVLIPMTAAERNGVEDARFVRFVEDDGRATYLATYTAFDGAQISQQLLQTDDFRTFSASPMVGPAAANKGLALFPRRICGRYAALSRHDRETNAVAFSDSLGHWGSAVTIQEPLHDWESIQLGNCGSPIETPDGWLVLTHGVGPMRTYSIGALLLALDDPTVVLASLREPLLEPEPQEQDGYVPNVVYSCGALLHGDTLVLPYGIADTATGIATASWAEVRATMR